MSAHEDQVLGPQDARRCAVAPLTNHQKDQLLGVLGYYMGLDLRAKVMAEVPLAYNAWMGRDIVRVVAEDERERVIG